LLATAVGEALIGDVTITWDEIRGLMAICCMRLTSGRSTTKLSDYLKENASTIGMRYSSENGTKEEQAAFIRSFIDNT